MGQDVIDSVIGGIRSPVSAVGGEELCFCEKDCSPVAFSGDNFRAIPEIRRGGSPGPGVFFVDGGDAELFSSPDACAHFIRVFHTVYRDNRRVSCSADEFYVLCQARDVSGSMSFSARLYRSDVSSLTDSFFEEELVFDPLDTGLLERNSRMPISRVPGFVRRIAELSTALILAGEAEQGDLIVIDGDFSARTRDEMKLLTALQGVAEKRRIDVCGVSKTSNLLTSSGRSVAHALSSLAPEGAWYYSPAAKRSGMDVYFAKLNPGSDYVFKIESFASTVKEEILPVLSANSTDAVFLGYPYGLIEADRFARVFSREKEMLRTMFMVKAGKGWESIACSERSLDAHSRLDSI